MTALESEWQLRSLLPAHVPTFPVAVPVQYDVTYIKNRTKQIQNTEKFCAHLREVYWESDTIPRIYKH